MHVDRARVAHGAPQAACKARCDAAELALHAASGPPCMPPGPPPPAREGEEEQEAAQEEDEDSESEDLLAGSGPPSPNFASWL